MNRRTKRSVSSGGGKKREKHGKAHCPGIRNEAISKETICEALTTATNVIGLTTPRRKSMQ
jgi:hypothetical protein